jgi:hypothetical protein
MIPLGPCPLNAETQHFILRSNKISLLCFMDTTEREVRERKEAQRQGEFTDFSNNSLKSFFQ